MIDWVLPALLTLGGLNLLVLVFLWLCFKATPERQSEELAAQAAWQQQQLAALLSQTERLERELRTEIAQSGVQGRQEAMQTLTLFQQSLLQQSAEATRTQNQQIDALAQGLYDISSNDHALTNW